MPPKLEYGLQIVINACEPDAIMQQPICTRHTVDLITHYSVMFESAVVTLPVSASAVSISLLYDLTLKL